ncbi:40S ribosomal protein S5-1 [Hordeum vulgare]|nr:40S ribosomal protein S5-1 [Hordeum vulgare]
MSEGMLHIHDVEGPKKTGSVQTRLEAMEQQVFKCQGMVERGLNANHMMITEFTSNHKMDAIDIGKHLSRLYDRVDQLQGHIYDLQNQNCVVRLQEGEDEGGNAVGRSSETNQAKGGTARVAHSLRRVRMRT